MLVPPIWVGSCDDASAQRGILVAPRRKALGRTNKNLSAGGAEPSRRVSTEGRGRIDSDDAVQRESRAGGAEPWISPIAEALGRPAANEYGFYVYGFEPQRGGAFKEPAPEARNRGLAQSRERWVGRGSIFEPRRGGTSPSLTQIHNHAIYAARRYQPNASALG